MANNLPKTKSKEPQYKDSTMPSFLISCYLILMFSFFPLFLTEQFGRARTDKYTLFLILSGVMIVGVVISSVLAYREERRVHRCTLRFMPLTAPDIAFLCFYGFAAISTLVSDYTKEAFFGTFTDNMGFNVGGRNNGLLLLTVYLLVYLAITRRYSFKDYVIAVYLIFSSFVALLAVLNYFYIDLLGIYDGYYDLWDLFSGIQNKPSVLLDFGSTLGNKNLISSFMCLFLPVAVMSFVLINKRYMRIISGVAICFAYAGLLCSDSSSGMLGLIAGIAIMAIFCARRYDSFKRYMLALAILFLSGKLLRLFSYLRGDKSKGFEFIQNFLLYSKKMYLPIILFAVIFVLMLVFEKKLEPHYPKKTILGVMIVLTAGVVIAGVYAVIHFTVIAPEAELSENLSRLLRFDEHWGTHRGYYWIKSLDEYKSFNFIHKLFGTGPDTVYAVMEPYFGEMLELFDEGSTDCVHNEFLNYFITQGILGLISYLAIIGTVSVRALRRAKENPMMLIFLSAVICYAAQSVVNIYQPITTPLFFIFLSMTEAMNRQVPLKKL